MASSVVRTASHPAVVARGEMRAIPAPDGVPWYIWCAVLAITSVAIGGNWDISWHMSIGRDTFWTPAHMAIYLCGVLAGIAFGYIIFSTTFVRDAPLAASSVHIWGFRAPLGAFIASWGGIAMLTSAPFDNWWHDAYGLDVKIISPPHILLFVGVYAVLLGTLVLLAGNMNRSTGTARQVSRYLILYCCGTMLVMVMTMLMEYTNRVFLHDSFTYIVLAALPPIMLSVAARATRLPFAATAVAGWYTLFGMGLILILPLFPAQPKLGPVYQNVTHFIPEEFPILLLVPAVGLDLLWQRTKTWRPWVIAAASGAVFLVLLLSVEWPFANFLMSPASRNAFFGTAYFWYGQPSTSHLVQNIFWEQQTRWEFWRDIAFAFAVATVSVRWGLSRGEWLRNVKR